jgi:ABC transport permease subunit
LAVLGGCNCELKFRYLSHRERIENGGFHHPGLLTACHSVGSEHLCYQALPADLIEQMDVIGVGSLRIVVVAFLCVGGAVVLNSASQFRRFGETALTANAVSLALLRELGPVFTALLVAGRNATAMAAELGSMIVTEQVDAIRAFGIDPIRKLMTPRVLATVLAVARGIGELCGIVRRILDGKSYNEPN